MAETELLTLFPRQAPRPQRGRAQALTLAVLLHLPFVTFLAIVLFFLEPLPETKLKPDVQVSLLPPPEIRQARPLLPSIQPKRQPAPDSANRSNQADPRPLAQPPGSPQAPEEKSNGMESPRRGTPEEKAVVRDEPLERTPPEPLTGESAGTPSAAAPPLSPEQENDPSGVIRQKSGALGQRNDDDLPPRPRASRGTSDGDGKALEFRQRLSKGYQGNIRFDNNDYDWDDYQTKIYWLIYNEWLEQLLSAAPRFSREQFQKGFSDVDSECSIHFVIHRNGRVSGITVVNEGRVVTLSEASSKTLSSKPLPPLPEDSPRDAEGLTFTFIIYGNTTAAALEYGLSRELANRRE